MGTEVLRKVGRWRRRRCLPDGAGGRRQGAHGVSHVVRNVDGQRGDLRLHRLHRGLRGFALGFLPAGQRRKRDLDVGAGEAEGAPAAGERRRRRIFALEISPLCDVTKGEQNPAQPGGSDSQRAALFSPL